MANRFLQTLVCAVLLAAAGSAAAQAYPSKAIKILVPFAAGSGADSNSRFYGDLASKAWGQPVVVENRPGGSGVIAAMAVKAAPADGYTLFCGTNSPITVNPIVMKDLPYEPTKDFRGVIMFGMAPVAFVVNASSPHRSIADLVQAVRKSGQPLASGTYSAGYELVAAWLATAAGIGITNIPYKGFSATITDITGNQVPFGTIDFGSVVPLVKDGRLRVLAQTGEARMAQLPEVPTMKESGYPDFVSHVWSSIMVRAETPDAIVDKLHQGFRAAMASPEGRKYQAARPLVEVNYTPKEMQAFVVSEHARFKSVAKAAGIQPR
jgi:tripartite-type tricarboxylate transporter receptor subunit TctC